MFAFAFALALARRAKLAFHGMRPTLRSRLTSSRDDRQAEGYCGGTILGDDRRTLCREKPSRHKALETRETPPPSEPQDDRDDPRRHLSNDDPDRFRLAEPTIEPLGAPHCRS
jgi:hypothetical protein